MTIQWFPGHMNSARRKAAETMAEDTLAPGGVEPEITLDLEAGAEQP